MQHGHSTQPSSSAPIVQLAATASRAAPGPSPSGQTLDPAATHKGFAPARKAGRNESGRERMASGDRTGQRTTAPAVALRGTRNSEDPIPSAGHSRWKTRSPSGGKGVQVSRSRQ